MRAMLIAVGVVALFVGCSQPLSPTSTIFRPGRQCIHAVGRNGDYRDRA